MRENRTYGSQGGEAKAFPTPIEWVRGLPRAAAAIVNSSLWPLSAPLRHLSALSDGRSPASAAWQAEVTMAEIACAERSRRSISNSA